MALTQNTNVQTMPQQRGGGLLGGIGQFISQNPEISGAIAGGLLEGVLGGEDADIPLGVLTGMQTASQIAEGKRQRQFELLKSISENQRKMGLLKAEKLATFQQDLPKDKQIQSSDVAIAAASRIRGLLTEDPDNPILLGAVQTQLPRLMGEVGVLTDKDVGRFGGSQALLAKGKQVIEKAVEGTLDEDNIAFMKRITAIMEKRAGELGKKRIDDIIGSRVAVGFNTKEKLQEVANPYRSRFVESAKVVPVELPTKRKAKEEKNGFFQRVFGPKQEPETQVISLEELD